MTELNQLSYDIIGCAYQVHKKLGPGLLESTYETCLCYELQKKGIQYERQKELNINYDGILLQNAYRIDLLVENKIMLELKAVDELKPIHTAQLLTYMKLSNIHIGLLINFNTVNLQNGIKRYAK
ncbi:MAG TPA: GxxExxY protein [Candidatus Phocaeicola excrementigallinarum]|nr:GxxExxY protein [Candidatus Phocaeicola excrementigallinarum]